MAQISEFLVLLPRPAGVLFYVGRDRKNGPARWGSAAEAVRFDEFEAAAKISRRHRGSHVIGRLANAGGH